MNSVATYRAGVIEAVTNVGTQAALSFDRDWSDAALDAITRLAASGRQFDADDVRDLVGEPPSPAAMGAAFRAAARARLIRCVGFETSSRITRHGGLQRVWEGVRDDPLRSSPGI
jgi:hypothetical protein